MISQGREQLRGGVAGGIEGVARSCTGEGAAVGRGHRGSRALEMGLRRGAAGVG